MEKEKIDELLAGIEASDEEREALEVACLVLLKYEEAFKELAK